MIVKLLQLAVAGTIAIMIVTTVSACAIVLHGLTYNCRQKHDQVDITAERASLL